MLGVVPKVRNTSHMEEARNNRTNVFELESFSQKASRKYKDKFASLDCES